MIANATKAASVQLATCPLKPGFGVEVLDFDSDFRERFFERSDALRRVHPGVDQSPRAMTIDKVNVDDRRPHRQRQKDLVDTGVDLNYFGRHLLLFRRSVSHDLRPCAPPP